jgi:hypothetical protein
MRLWVGPVVIGAMIFCAVLVGLVAWDIRSENSSAVSQVTPTPGEYECFDFGVPTPTPTPPGEYNCR